MSLDTKLTKLRAEVEQSIVQTPDIDQPSTYLLDTITKLLLIEYLSSNSILEPSAPDGRSASAANQLVQIDQLIEIRDRLPENGFFKIATPQRLTYQNLGANSSGVIKASSGSVLALTLYNQSPSTRWIQLFDSSIDNIVEGDIPKETYPIFTEVFLILDSNHFGEKGAIFDNGIAFGFSSTGNSYTPASASFQLHLKYI